MPDDLRRRASDRIDPDVQLAINDGDAENRHVLRNEFAAAVVTMRADLATIRQDVQAGNLADRTEFAQLQATQLALGKDVDELKDWKDSIDPRVQTLEAGAFASREVATLKRWVIGAAAIPSLAILATLLAHHHL